MAGRRKRLRSGFTTGAAAAAAVKGAMTALLTGERPSSVNIPFLSEGSVDVPVYSMEKRSEDVWICSVIKDGGDDPDITHKAEIGAVVRLGDVSGDLNEGKIEIRGGKGVGRVTKPGLEVKEGESAINSGPVKMIRQAVTDVFKKIEQQQRDVFIEIFVPEGEKLAEKTLNNRLGIIGGISILGTTGIVKPLSHDAYISTITSALSVASAMGHDTVVLTTGRRSERFAQSCFPALPDEAFIQIGDFFQMALKESAALFVNRVFLAVFFGKALKMAQGIPHTHAGKSELTMKKLAEWVMELTGEKALTESVAAANTARHAFSYLVDDYPEVIAYVGEKVVRSAEKFAEMKVRTDCLIFDFDGKPVFCSDWEVLNGS